MTPTGVLRGLAVAGLLAVLGLSITGPALAADALTSVGDELAVGKNRTGEACRIKLVDSRAEFDFRTLSTAWWTVFRMVT